LLVTHALNAGCTSDAAHDASSTVAGMGPAGVTAAAGTGGAAGSTLSFAKDIYERVIRVRCANCHNDAPSFGGLAFVPGAATAYGNLVGVPAGSEPTYLCRDSGLLRVKPGDPEHSLLYLKLTMPSCGSKMPPAAFGQVTEEQVSLVRQWIADGAPP
jgi:mono/diheme cytochrome c family protein